MNNEIIIVKQLPIIVEQLQTIKADVSQRTEKALSLICTEDTLATVKKERANLNKEFAEWEEKRKEVKNAVMSPYEQFETVYKDCITDVFKDADKELKKKIDSVESELKEKKKAEVIDYFNEYKHSKGIIIAYGDFIQFEQAEINITLSASMKSLKTKAQEFIDRICDDLNLIETQEHSDEILYEYKQTLNVSSAITSVTNRHKAIEAAQAREAEKQAQKETVTVNEPVEAQTPLAPPKVETATAQTYSTSFRVTGTMEQLKNLKAYMNAQGLTYEQI